MSCTYFIINIYYYLFLNLKWLPVMRRDDGEIESFSFDIGKCDQVVIANSLWRLSTNGDTEELQTALN